MARLVVLAVERNTLKQRPPARFYEGVDLGGETAGLVTYMRT